MFRFYNVSETEVAQNELGELTYSFCDTISVEALKSNIRIKVTNGQLPNGLYVLELLGKNGCFEISYDEKLGANVVSNPDFYQELKTNYNPYVIDLTKEDYNIKRIYLKPNILDFFNEIGERVKQETDYYKYCFYLVKLYLSRNQSEGTDLDIAYWEKYLKMSDKTTLIDDTKWEKFFRILVRYSFFGEEIESRSSLNFDCDDFAAANEYAKIDNSPTFEEKKDIFFNRKGDGTTIISHVFLRFVEKIDFYSTALADNVESALEKKNNVIQITSNKYRYSPHPYTKFLKENGIKSLEELKTKVTSHTGRAILGCSVHYWKEMFEKIKTFDEIDDYDISLLTFAEINSLLKLGFGDRQVKQYSQGKYCLRTGKTAPDLMKLDYKTNIPYFASHNSYVIYKKDFEGRYVPYTKTINDYEIAVIGPDNMKYSNHHYIEDMPVTSKIDKYCKFNRFITNKYSSILEKHSSEFFREKNDYGFDKKCNSCLGFCVEYYAKIKLFGENTFRCFIDAACNEAKSKEVTDPIRVRAAMIIYREEMKRCYGSALVGILPSISITKLLEKNYSAFVDKVVELGNITAQFVLDNVYGGKIDSNTRFYDPDLSVNHISALCDFISKDTILDLKCTSAITEKHLKQVLSYYYLSTKRSDLKIKRLIVFDAPTQKYIEIKID